MESKVCVYCSREFLRPEKYGDKLWEKRRFCSTTCYGAYRRTHEICSVEGCGRPHKAKGYCDPHYLHMYRHGTIVHKRRDHEFSGMWKGNKVGYAGAHDRVEHDRGKAAACKCACGRRARDWAFKHEDAVSLVMYEKGRPYSPNPDDYVPLCTPCHRKLDFAQRSERRLYG